MFGRGSPTGWYFRLCTLPAALIAVFAFHASGTGLIVTRIVWIVAIVGVVAMIRRRRSQG